jgi:cytochrome c oxidase subunit II
MSSEAAPRVDNVNHFRRLAVIWFVVSLIATLLVVLVLAPGLPPGNGTVESSGQVVDNTVLFGISTPVAMAVLVYFIYAMIAFRERDLTGPVLDGPPIRGDAQVQAWWLVITTTIVLFLAGYGTVRLLVDGSGGGQGPNPIAAPAGSSHALQVQVIAQQWKFDYRFPGYGGLETESLELPANRMIEFHVTSLDVIHSFWAYQLGVKADANPGVDNIAYVTTKAPLIFNVHCAELCGVWHGYMFSKGRVVPPGQFASWIQQQRRQFAPISKFLTPYAKRYFPAPGRRGG